MQGAYTWTTLVTKYLLIINMKRNKNYIIIFNIWGGDYIRGGGLYSGGAYIWNGVNVNYLMGL